MPPMLRSRIPRDSRVTRRMLARQPMRPTLHAQMKPAACGTPLKPATQWTKTAQRRTRQRQAARRERKSTSRQRATRMRRLHVRGNAASQSAAPEGQESYVRSHRPIRPPHAAGASGASSAQAIDTSGASCAPGADASSRRSRRCATRALRWRIMSRQALHSTRRYANRQRPEARFYV